ncbi:TPA: hypothetical protein ACGUTS_003955 [Vibrio vulnificus]
MAGVPPIKKAAFWAAFCFLVSFDFWEAFASLPVCQFASLPVCQFASLPVCQFASLPVCQFASP